MNRTQIQVDIEYQGGPRDGEKGFCTHELDGCPPPQLEGLYSFDGLKLMNGIVTGLYIYNEPKD